MAAKDDTLVTYLTAGRTEFKLVKDGDRRWLEVPALRIEDDTDAEHVVKVIQEALMFLEEGVMERLRRERQQGM